MLILAFTLTKTQTKITYVYFVDKAKPNLVLLTYNIISNFINTIVRNESPVVSLGEFRCAIVISCKFHPFYIHTQHFQHAEIVGAQQSVSFSEN